MENKIYKIKDLIKEYKKTFNKDIIIKDENNIGIIYQLNYGKLGHLMGLHYMDSNNRASNSTSRK